MLIEACRTWGVVGVIGLCGCGGSVHGAKLEPIVVVDAGSDGASGALDAQGSGATVAMDARIEDAGTTLAMDGGGEQDGAACNILECACRSLGDAQSFFGVQDESCSDSPDPFVAVLEACPGCHYAGAGIVVGNLGGVPVPAPLTITLMLDGVVVDQAVIDEPIPPGALVALDFQRDFFGNALTAELDFLTDCNPSNNRATVTLVSLGCLP